MEVHLIIRRSHFWGSVFEPEGSLLIESAMKKAGVIIHHEISIQKIKGNENVEKIELENGQEITCDLLAVGIGITFDLDWMKQVGVETSQGILANRFLQTNISNIWTAGDVAEFEDIIIQESIQYGNWVNAMRQGVYVGTAMTGQKMNPFSFVSSYTSSGFGLHLGFAGCVKKNPDRTIQWNGSSKEQKWSQSFYKNNRLIGMILINQLDQLGKYIQEIQK
jgi:NAD(P)H-nitrite reductase large subunit